MTNTLVHRGPDSCGYYVNGSVGLGFRRLSLIDLKTGDQPIYNEDRSLVLICNGEIFNYAELKKALINKGHKFYTRTDVEVIPHLYEEYGISFLDRLNGQFAFALYDRNENSLLLARDQCGICPLFYAVFDHTFIFGSEVKAILAHASVERRVDLTGLDQVFTLPGLVSPRTMFHGICSLQNGHFLVVKNGDLQVRQYWDLDYPPKNEVPCEKPEHYYAERLEELLVDSVMSRLHADVPVGVYISGGLDSSLITCIASKVDGRQLYSFAVAFDDPDICESRYQRQLVAQVNSNHHETIFDCSQVSNSLRAAVYHAECPLKETYNTASMALSRAARNAKVKAVLTGEGADELFAGYVGYRFDQLNHKRGLTKQKMGTLDDLLEEELRLKLWGDENLFYEKNFHAFKEIKLALYSSELNETFPAFDCLNDTIVDKEKLQDRDFIQQRSYLDFKLRLVDHLVSDHGDRVSLANSVEGRYPFLDKNVIEFARLIPSNLKLNGFTDKYLLRRIANGFVPRDIAEREKFAFQAPASPSLLRENREWINDLLSFQRIQREGYFNPFTVERLKAKYRQREFKLNLPYDDDLLIIILTFGIFLEAFDMPSLN